MSHPLTHATPPAFAQQANLTPDQYRANYERSLRDPDGFWAERAACVEWQAPFQTVSEVSFDPSDLHIRWYPDGQLNAAHNCIDRHAATQPDRVALIWEGDDPNAQKTVTYGELKNHVSRLANALKALGVERGDRVTIYMPMVLEAAYAMLACARIGAVHSVVFGGFSPDSLAGRIADCGSNVVITADEGVRGGKKIPLKANVDMALSRPETDSVRRVLVLQHTGADVPMQPNRDVWYHEALSQASADCPPAVMNAEDPLFILYTSGSTGKPKGVLHTTAGYLVYVTTTFNDCFDLKPDDVFWCTADLGWVTGHSYLLYGALSNGTTTVLFEGVPQYPTWSRVGDVVDKHGVTILYTAPTAIRAMMREGDEPLKQSHRQSLRLLGSVGEPINPEAWEWYRRVVGGERCPIVDTWWQTETGGLLMVPLPNAGGMKPGAAMRPYYGIEPAIVDDQGRELDGECEGNLVLKGSWPGQMRTVYGDHNRFISTYFTAFPSTYCTGDGAKRDADGDYWITGRVDDVLNVSGHRIGTAEIESSLVGHDAVAEAAVVGMPHDIKGQGICAFVTLQAGTDPTDALRQTLREWVRRDIGPIATPDALYYAQGLPKTRSGKIMRRILRKIVANELDSLGDTSTLADPSVVDSIITEVYPATPAPLEGL